MRGNSLPRFLLVVLGLVVALAFSGTRAESAPADSRGPVVRVNTSPEYPQGIKCLSIEIDGAQLYHKDFETPLYTEKEVRAELRRFGAELKLRGLVTGEPRVKSDADRIVAVAEGKTGGTWEVGNVCYVLMRYCAPGCTGQGCMTVRVPSVQ